MKRAMLMAALLLAQVSCVGGGDSAVRLLHARVLKEEAGACSLSEVSITQGTLDVSGGRNYLLGINIESNLADPTLAVGNVDFNSRGHNDVILNELVLSYRTEPSVALPQEESIPVYLLLRAESNEQSFLVFPAIGPQAFAQLRGAVGLGQQVTLIITVKARGEMGGKQGTVETNAMSFPIVLLNSGFDSFTGTCPSGGQPVPGEICRPQGQDAGHICPIT
jgi:hypothetical protein